MLADRCLQAKTHCNNLTPCPAYQPVEASSESISPYRRSESLCTLGWHRVVVRNGLRGMTTAGHRPCWSHAGRTRDPARHNGAHAMERAARHDPQNSPPPHCTVTPCQEPACFPIRNALIDRVKKTSGDPESNQGPSDICTILQSDALPTELSPVLAVRRNASAHKGKSI